MKKNLTPQTNTCTKDCKNHPPIFIKESGVTKCWCKNPSNNYYFPG